MKPECRECGGSGDVWTAEDRRERCEWCSGSGVDREWDGDEERWWGSLMSGPEMMPLDPEEA